jgi:hypothetical protein
VRCSARLAFPRVPALVVELMLLCTSHVSRCSSACIGASVTLHVGVSPCSSTCSRAGVNFHISCFQVFPTFVVFLCFSVLLHL